MKFGGYLHEEPIFLGHLPQSVSLLIINDSFLFELI